MTGSGNDFVLLDGRHDARGAGRPSRIVGALRPADRRRGRRPRHPDARRARARVRMVFWNSDGSRAAMCGNAALCSTRLAVFLELAAPGDLRLLTDAGVVAGPLRRTRGDQAEIRLPDFDLASGAVAGVCELGAPASAGSRSATVGVPHLVVRVDDIEARRPRRARAESSASTAARTRRGQRELRRRAGGAGRALAHPDLRAGRRGRDAWPAAPARWPPALALAARGEATLPMRFRSRGGQSCWFGPSLARGARDRGLAWRAGQAGVPGGLGGTDAGFLIQRRHRSDSIQQLHSDNLAIHPV